MFFSTEIAYFGNFSRFGFFIIFSLCLSASAMVYHYIIV